VIFDAIGLSGVHFRCRSAIDKAGVESERIDNQVGDQLEIDR
jgi:hypothetical protein